MIDRFPGDLDARICSFTNSMGGKTLAVNVGEIVSCMLELYKRHGDQYQWLASSGNFFNAMCEFLRTRDCFLDTPPHPTVKVTFSASLSAQGEPSIIGDLKRFGPLVAFNRLDAFTSEDAWCHIYPSYAEPILDSLYPSFLGRPEYRLASDWIKFEWNSAVDGFSGYVRPNPKCGDEVNTRLNVDLATVSKRFFPGGVAFERTLRVRIKLSVCRVSKISTASPKESLPHLERCRGNRRSLVHPPPGLEDLGGIMKANKRAAASSPAKSFGSTRKSLKTPKSTAQEDFIRDLLERTRPESRPATIEVNAMLDPGIDLNQVGLPESPPESWGTNVPAWHTFPARWAKLCESPSEVSRKLPKAKCKKRSQAREACPDKPSPALSPSLWHSERPSASLNPFRMHKQQPASMRPRTAFFENMIRNAVKPPDSQQSHPSTDPSTATRLRSRVPCAFSLPPDCFDDLATSQSSDDEYVVHQPPDPASSHDLSYSSTPLEMKRTPRPTKKHNCDITLYPGPSWSPQPPATALPGPAYPRHSRHDSALSIRKTASSMGLPLWTPPAACPAYPRHAQHDSVMGIHRTASSSANLAPWTSPPDSNASTDETRGEQHQHDSFATDPTQQHQSFVPDGQTDAEAQHEALRREMKEWYDAMVLQRDTPRRLTKEEKSEEEAYMMAFLCGEESGDEGDVDGEV